MREDKVYVLTKRWFIRKGFIALAGQPPNGCDNIPTIEIKHHSNLDKGSKGSYKPDLVVANQESFILVECKPKDDPSDEDKLLSVLRDSNRLRLLFSEINQRHLLERRGLIKSYKDFNVFEGKLRLCLAHGGLIRQMDKVAVLSFELEGSAGVFMQPSDRTYQIPEI